MSKIDLKKWYTVKEISGMGIMKASSDDTRRQMLLRHIREGRIKATNLGGELKPRYVVLGKDLQSYSKAVMKPGDYATK